MEAVWVKVTCLFCTLFLGLGFGTLPHFILSCFGRAGPSTFRRDRIINLLNCFAGGVFLGALFLEMIIEGGEEFEKYKNLVGYTSSFPFYNVIVVTGFFLTATIEYCAHSFLHNSQVSLLGNSTSNENGESRSLRNGDKSGYGTIREEAAPIVTPQVQRSTAAERGVGKTNPLEARVSLGHNAIEDGMEDRNAHTGEVTIKATFPNQGFASLQLRSILLLLALSFHSIFDGLALGLQDTASQVWEVFAAVAVHKCIVAFCLGLDIFVSSSSPKIAAAMMGIFSLISPVGTAIGISLTSSGLDEAAQTLSSSILQGLACGTFVYVTFLEILSTSWKNGTGKNFLDIICAFIGFTVMVIAIILD